MKKILLFSLILVCVALMGCSTRLSMSEGEAQYGPLPENYQQLVAQAIPKYLIDPTSAIIDFNSYGFLEAPYPMDSHNQISGWRCWVWVNAKNRMGGYTGRKPWFCVIRFGQVIGCFTR